MQIAIDQEKWYNIKIIKVNKLKDNNIYFLAKIESFKRESKPGYCMINLLYWLG